MCIRDRLDISQIVPGDIIRLSAGDMLPGDVLFLTAKDAFIAQSALTGESNPVEKYDHPRGEGEALTDIANLGFMGSNMVSGSATAVVAATGNNTYFGSMAKALSGERAKNSFEQGVDSVSRLLLRCVLIMVPVADTHLDVYKRQVSGAHAPLPLYLRFFCRERSISAADRPAGAFPVLAPVYCSFQDVYKRQVSC